MKRSIARCVFILASMIALSAHGQAWVAPKGEAAISLTYQYSNFPGHINNDGSRDPVNGSQSQGVTLQLDYSASDRLGISASLPYLATRLGSNPAPGFPRPGIDDGKYHSSWQDFHLDARYNVLTQPLVLTPFLTIVIPSHHYQTTGETAIGRDLREAHLGFDIGRLLDPLLPRAYVDSHIGYVFSQKVLGVKTDRAIAKLSAGYFITPRWSSRLIANFQKVHGGVTSDQFFGHQLPPDVSLGHDRLLRDDHLHAGLGFDYAVTPTVDVYATYIKLVWGRNTHYGHAISAGIARTFPPRIR
jgi:hypothetical protein